MPKLKILSGQDIVKILISLGFQIDNQKGSHIKMKRLNINGTKEILTIPNHKELDRGTLKAIIRQASKYITETEINNSFYQN